MRRGGIYASRQGYAVTRGLRLVARSPRSVGRGLDPAADVCFVFTFSGKRQNPVRLYKIWFLHSPYVFLYLRQYGFCPDSWPRFRGRHCGTNALRWFCLRQKPKKPPLVPRRGARPRANPGALQHRHALPSGSICCVAQACNTYSIAAPSLLASATVWQAVRRFRTTGFTQGPAGPFGNPGASRGSPETVSVPPKAKALCYNTVSLLPVRLIRAPVLKPRPHSQAGQPAGCLVPIWQTSSSRPVCRGRMHAARGRSPCGNVFDS